MPDTPAPPRPPLGGRVYTCKLCGGRGHNSRTCGMTAEDREKRREQQRRRRQKPA